MTFPPPPGRPIELPLASVAHPIAPEVPDIPAFRERPPPVIALPPSAQRVADYGLRFHVLARRLEDALSRRARYTREIHGFLANVHRLRTLAERMQHASDCTALSGRPPCALAGRARELEEAAFARLNVLCPFEVSHPGHHLAVTRIADDILDLFHDPDGIRAVEDLAADATVSRPIRLAVLQIAYGWMADAAEQVERTHRVPRLADLIDDAFDDPGANAAAVARESVERVAEERIETAGEAIETLATAIEGSFKLLGVLARTQLAAEASGSRRGAQADRLVEWIQRSFDLDDADVRHLRHAVETGEREAMEHAEHVLEERIVPSRAAGSLGPLLQLGLTLLSYASLFVLLSEPAARHDDPLERIHWDLEVAVGATEAAIHTITLFNRAGQIATRGREGTLLALQAVADCAERAERALPVVEAVINVVEGVHDIDMGRYGGDDATVGLGVMRVAGGTAVAFGLLFSAGAVTGIGTVITVAAAALSGLRALEEATLPPCLVVGERILRGLRSARGTDRTPNRRLAVRLGVLDEVEACIEAAQQWGWWGVIPPVPPEGVSHADWDEPLRDGERRALGDAGFSREEIEPMVRDLLPAAEPNVRVEDLVGFFGALLEPPDVPE